MKNFIFRVWDANLKVMINNVSVDSGKGTNIIGFSIDNLPKIEVPKGFELEEWLLEEHNYSIVNDWCSSEYLDDYIMQWTGFKDMEGTFIFEEDIVIDIHSGIIMIVDLYNCSPVFRRKDKKHIMYSVNNVTAKSVKVIGNTYQYDNLPWKSYPKHPPYHNGTYRVKNLNGEEMNAYFYQSDALFDSVSCFFNKAGEGELKNVVAWKYINRKNESNNSRQ